MQKLCVQRFSRGQGRLPTPLAAPATVKLFPAGGDEGFQDWWDRLAAVTGRYSRVLMLGDSMGATAALLFSPLATAVHAFTPQVGFPNHCSQRGVYPQIAAQPLNSCMQGSTAVLCDMSMALS